MSKFEFKFDCKPDYGFVTVTIPAGETLKVEASAMATMSTNLKMKAKMGGGVSRLLSGESLFVTEFTAEGSDGEIGIAPAAPGDIEHVYLEDETIYLQNSAYVASSPELNMDTKFQGVKGFFSGEGLFLAKCSGTGDLFFNTFGGMLCIDVDGEYIVDNGHIVAFTEGLEYGMTTVGGLKSAFFSGEGLVCKFTGKGKVWIQTRLVPAFASWTWPFRPEPKSN